MAQYTRGLGTLIPNMFIEAWIQSSGSLRAQSLRSHKDSLEYRKFAGCRFIYGSLQKLNNKDTDQTSCMCRLVRMHQS